MLSLIIFKCFAVLFNTCDYFLTIYALKLGAKEANPIARFGLKRFPKLTFILKCIVFNIMIINVTDFYTIYFLNLLFGWVCVHNTKVIKRRQKFNENKT